MGATQMTGADVGRIAQQTVGAVGSRDAPTGSRGLLGGKTVAREMNQLAAKIKALEAEATVQLVATEQLTKAELALAIATEEQAAQAARVAASSAVTAELAQKRIAVEQAAEAAEIKTTMTLKQRVDAYKEEIKATKELAKQEKKTTVKLNELEKGVTTAASDLAARTGKGAGKAEQPKYSQRKLESIFGRQPGTAGKIAEVAKRYDFKPSDIKKVTEYANSYTQLQFAAQGANGVMRKLILTTDRAGNVFTSTQKQFRTFFGAIKRNVTEMIKWSAATLVVWGAIRKLGELLEIAIENETRLASIAVVLGEEHANLTDVFNSAAEAAAATGESIDGVLEGYVQAFRATGNIADETERAAMAQALLTDALTLSKLSALTTAESMDVLTGAMRQAGLGFDEGSVLLDKWVAVSRIANVSIETLAESFAITATSASNAGLTWDELNGIIATLAESTTLSATESGNAIRAFISGFNTDTAVKELTKYGISVTDSTGETRGFLDVMKEISALFEAGIISEGELNKISRAIGGGARREAQVATTIKNLGRAQDVAAESAKAHGDAERALNIQLDTVQTAITKLSNSFQKLARAMGSEGGVLETAGSVLNIFTKMVDATSALTKNLGDMTPILAGMAVLFAATSKQTRGLFATNIIAGIGGFINRRTGGGGALSIEEQRLDAGLQGGFVTTGDDQSLGSRFQKRALGPGLGRNAGSLLGQGLAGGFTAFSAIRDLTQGNKAGAAGSIVGGIIGGLISGGSPIGIVIGTAAGEAFANATINYKTQFTNFFKDIFDESLPEGARKGEPSSEEAAQSAVFAQFGLGSEALGKFMAKSLAVAGNIGYQGGAVLGNLTGGAAFGEYTYKEGAPGADISPEKIALFGTLGMEAADQVFELNEQLEALKGFDADVKPGAFDFAIVKKQTALLVEYKDELAGIEEAQADAFRAAAISGAVTGKEFKDAFEQITALQTILTKYEAAFGDTLRSMDEDVIGVTGSFDFWTNIVVRGTTEQIARLNTLSDEYASLQNAAETAMKLGQPDVILIKPDDPITPDVDESKTITRKEKEALESDITERAVLEAQSLTRAINKERIVIPTVLDLDLKESDFGKFEAELQRVQDQTFEGWWAEGLNKDFNATQIADTFAPFFIALGKDGAGKYLEGFDQGFATEAFENLVRRGEIIPEKKDEPIGLQQLDISSAELPGVMEKYYSLVASTQSQLAAKGVEWSPNEETFAALLNDYVALPITADLTLLNIAMQELIEVNKDQLDGIYNLPTDASFYVPFSGYKEGFVNQGQSGGTGGDLSGYVQGLADEAAKEEKEPLEDIEKLLKPDRWQVEQDARIQNQIDRQSEEAWPSEGRFKGITPEMYGYEKPPRFQLPSVTELIFGKGLAGGFKTAMDALKDYREAEGTPSERFMQIEGISGIGDFFERLIGPPPVDGVGFDPLGGPDQVPAAGGLLGELRDLLSGLFGTNGEEPTITTKLQIESTTTTIVQLDGQVIANAIKPYLLNDEIRYEGTAGAAVKRFVI